MKGLVVVFLGLFVLPLMAETKQADSKEKPSQNSPSKEKSSSAGVSEEASQKKTPAVQGTPIKNWKFVREMDGVFTYQLANNPKVLGVFHQEKTKKKLDWKKIGSEEFFENLTTAKQEMMSMIRITDWQADEHKWKRKKKHFELTIKGSYTDGDGEKVFFQERHFYYPRITRQVLLTATGTALPADDQIGAFVRQARAILKK